MAFSFECFVITHIGNRRKNNEDNFFIGKLLTPDEQRSMSQSENRVIQKKIVADGAINRIFAVSDGMGGHKHGEVASCMVTEALDKFTGSHQVKASRKRSEKFAYIQAFQEMIQQTNLNILEHADGENEIENMGSTLSGLIVFADEVAPFNIGDSSTFLFENGTLQKLTIDDNEAARFEKSGVELVSNGKRLIKYFGLPKSSGVLTATVSTPIPLRAGQIFVVSSDGLTDCLSPDSISKILGEYTGNPEKASAELVEAALHEENGGRDNITVVVLKIQKSSK